MAKKHRTLAEYLKGRKLKDVAGECGCSSAYLSMIAAGKRTPKLPLAVMISEKTGVPVESLIGDGAAA